MAKTLQRPNWRADIEYYPAPEFTEPLEYSIEQVWDGTAEGHERLVKQCTEAVESWRDRFGGAYSCFWGDGPQGPYLRPGASNACRID